MKFGHFDDAHREYVIDTPRTPLPWINYLGSEDFFSLVSNTGGGYSFYRDARLRRITRYRYNNSPLDMDGHRIYINDGGTIWNPGWQPTKTELDSYSCRHGLGYTILTGEKNGIRAQQELFVPRGDACEIDRLTQPDERVARSLAALFHPQLYPGVGSVLRITQQELAYLVGLSRQCVNQALHTLQAAQVIRIEYGGVRVLTLAQLHGYRHPAADRPPRATAEDRPSDQACLASMAQLDKA